jgi:protein-tyrosine phosphatase
MQQYITTQWKRLFGLNLSQVTPLLYVGGQFQPEQWPAIAALGIVAVLSLQAEREDQFAGPEPARLLRLPVIDFTPPSLDQLDEGVAFVTTCVLAEQPVLVHCHSGIGRAPVMAAAYLMANQALSHRDALERVRAARPIIGPNLAQLARLREYELLLRRRRAAEEGVL